VATIAKFYALDALSPNTGTMPTFSPAQSSGFTVTGDAAGAATARDATDVAGTSNPDIESQITSNADSTQQAWGHRRFVSRPLAAHTFAAADGNWTFSYARSESNLLHNQAIGAIVYCWRPSSGAQVGTWSVSFTGTEPASASTETAESLTAAGVNTSTIIDGDILVFDVWTAFIQGMNTAYTDQFAYNGTTEASTTTCATFVTPPAALTLFAGGATTNKALTATAVGVTASLLTAAVRGLTLTADAVAMSATLDTAFIPAPNPMVLALAEGRPIFGPF
jgi:hypothetical protein